MSQLMHGAHACHSCTHGRAQVVEEGEEIVYTYDVYWQESDTTWAGRWGMYMHPPRSSHWMTLCNAVIVLVACCSSLGIILSRVTGRDLMPAGASLPDKVRCSLFSLRCAVLPEDQPSFACYRSCAANWWGAANGIACSSHRCRVPAGLQL